MKKNTGNYRICEQIIGQGQTRSVLFSFSNKAETITKFNSLKSEISSDIYCEEEVIYIGTHLDENGNTINSAPTWCHFNV